MIFTNRYILMCEYYIKTGDKAMATAYMDSTIAFNERYLNKYNSTHIMRAEQELFEAENNAQSEELRYQKEIYNERFLYGGSHYYVHILGTCSIYHIVS